ncbi:hypothetical protein GCM10011534_11890 [Pseudooceanicola nanhaiensis]|uniref:Uncharacterized protein n=1 Tax=Pseudooceanicola nanhaiensis TaxID=375761 RepID=A0A917WBF5_9RHOB|nr:hypothetical protein GCM10011534_11890 [Pseudooceanicola nanhaiensis]
MTDTLETIVGAMIAVGAVAVLVLDSVLPDGRASTLLRAVMLLATPIAMIAALYYLPT